MEEPPTHGEGETNAAGRILLPPSPSPSAARLDPKAPWYVKAFSHPRHRRHARRAVVLILLFAALVKTVYEPDGRRGSGAGGERARRRRSRRRARSP